MGSSYLHGRHTPTQLQLASGTRALRPEDPSLAALYDETRRELERASLPAEFSGIASTRQLTREQLAALLFVKLRTVLGNGPSRVNVIATDIGDSWAEEFIRCIGIHTRHMVRVGRVTHTARNRRLLPLGQLAGLPLSREGRNTVMDVQAAQCKRLRSR